MILNLLLQEPYNWEYHIGILHFDALNHLIVYYFQNLIIYNFFIIPANFGFPVLSIRILAPLISL